MNEPYISEEVSDRGAKKEIDFVELLIMLAAHKKLLIVLPLVTTLLAGLFSLTMPNMYRANVKLLPPQQVGSAAAGLLAQLGGMAGVVSGAAGVKTPNDVYIAMLKSRTVADKLINRFHLNTVYNAQSPEASRKALEGVTDIQTGKDGLITIVVTGTDQKLVAPLANAYVDELLNLTRVLAVTESSQRRKFYEQQLELAKNNLASAEVALKQSLETHGVISVDSESRTIVETVSRLRAQIAAKEIQLNSMSAFVTNNNPEYLRAQEELVSSRAQLSKLENGTPSGAAGMPGNRQEGLANIKMLREVKYYQMLYELLAKQYEAARLDEAKDASVIQVLDRALEPEHRFKPKRSLVVLAGGLLGLFLACAWAFAAAIYKSAMQSPARAAQFSRLASHLKR
jgi:uncharacterized protein involved in exopolysaccharide biosynthesis